MTQGYSNVSSLNSLFANIFEDAVFVARERNIMTSLVTVFNDQTGDQTRTNSTYPQISASSVTEADDFSNPTQFGKTSITTLTPGEIMAQVLLTDRRIETDAQAARNDASLELGMAIADKIESDLLGNFSSLTGGTIGNSGSTLTWGHFFAARAVLRGGKVPGPYVAVLHEYQWYDLAKAVAPSATVTNIPAGMLDDIARRWYVGTIADVDIYTTANITRTGGTAAVGGMFNRAAIAFDNRRAPRLEPERDASKRAWELNITAKYAHGVWRPTFGVQIKSDVTTPTS